MDAVQILEELRRRSTSGLPGLVGLEVSRVEDGHAYAKLAVGPQHLAPHGYLHAAVVVALADTAAGYGCFLNLPPSATSFTTIEMKLNFLRTATSGTLSCDATLVHGGRTTQVWDATVSDDAGRTVALFRCTQLILYSEPKLSSEAATRGS